MKISDLQHLEVICEETKIEGGATALIFVGLAINNANAIITGPSLQAITFAGGTLTTTAFTNTGATSTLALDGLSGAGSAGTSEARNIYTPPA